MDAQRNRVLPRDAIGEFIGSPRGVRAFENLQSDTDTLYQAVNTASFLTLTDQPSLGSERVLALADGEITGTDAGANSTYTLGLANTAVVSDAYGDASHLVRIVIDAKGRATAAQSYVLNSDNVTEGATNLFFTNARARAALSDGAGIDYNSTTGVISATPAGTYGTPTGTLARATFATYAAPTISNPPTQAEVQAIADALQVVSQTLAALITDMEANGNLS